jgi:hypothetical protein
MLSFRTRSYIYLGTPTVQELQYVPVYATQSFIYQSTLLDRAHPTILEEHSVP